MGAPGPVYYIGNLVPPMWLGFLPLTIWVYVLLLFTQLFLKVEPFECKSAGTKTEFDIKYHALKVIISHSFVWSPHRGTPANIRIYFILPIFLPLMVWVYFHSKFCGRLWKTHFSAKDCSRSSKVNDFDTNQKRVCNFLLVISSNLGPVFHRFCDTAS